MKSKSTVKSIGVTDLQRNFRAVFDGVISTKQACILTRDSRPEVVMIPFDLWTRIAPLAGGRVRKEDLYFDFAGTPENADEFLAWRERERMRELDMEKRA